MKTGNRILTIVFICVLILSACAPAATETQPPAPTAAIVPSPTPRPEVNVALEKPVRVSASWVVDPPERAVNGNPNDWWGAGGPIPQWIEVDLEGIYTVSRIRVINEGPTGYAAYQVYGRGPDNVNRLLHVFEGNKTNNQTLEFTPQTPWEDISTIRIEINSGSGWVGFREIQIFSRGEPEPLPESTESETPLFLAGVNTDGLEQITPANAILMKQLAIFGRGPINDLALSPDGTMLAAASPLGVWLYDPKDLKSEPRLLEGHTRDVLSVIFSPDGKTILSASQDGTVKIWDVATASLTRTVAMWNNFAHEIGDAPRENEVWSIAFSSDVKLLATGAYDGKIRLWNPMVGNQKSTLQGHTRQVSTLTFNAEGTLLASNSVDGAIIVWDVAAGSQRFSLKAQTSEQRPAFSPDGKTLAVAYGGADMPVQLYDTVSGNKTGELTGHTHVLSMEFIANGLVTSSLDGKLQFWDAASGVSRLISDKSGWITNLAFSSDGSLLAVSDWYGVLGLWDMVTGNLTGSQIGHNRPVTSVAFSPDGARLASGGEDGVIWVWNVKSNTLDKVMVGRGRVSGVAFSPDGKLLASSSFDKTVRLWDTTTAQQVAVLEGHESLVRCVAFSPDGKLVASGSTDQTVRLWDAATGEERAVLKGHGGEVESVAFSQDGAWLVSGSADKTIRIWNVAAAEEARVLRGNLSFVNDAAFNPDGTRVVSAGADHSLRFWELIISPGKITDLELPIDRGHPGWVLSVDYSPDGQIVASANLSTTSFYVTPGEIHLYLSETAYPLALLRGHTKRVTSVAFSPDGKLLATGSADGSTRLWGTESEGIESESKPVTDSAAPTPASAPAAASWREDFDGSLAEGWRWVRENSAKWNLTENPGFLRVYDSPYEVNGKTQNLFLRDAPAGDFSITTHVYFEPKTNFQFAGLTIYQDDSNILSFGRAFCGTQNVCVGNGIYFDNIIGGNWTGGNFATSVNTTDEAYLRLERRANVVTASFSYDGENWFEIGSHTLKSGFLVTGVGLFAYGDYDKSDADLPADFDFFELSEIP